MSTRRLNNIRMLAEAIENLYESENLLIDFEESPTNIKHIISKEGKKVLKYEKHTQNRYSQNICPILNEPFNENHEIIELPCKHIFDRDSILFWLENHKSECPVCRFKLPSKEQSNVTNIEPDPEQRGINHESLFEEEKDDEINFSNETFEAEEKEDETNYSSEPLLAERENMEGSDFENLNTEINMETLSRSSRIAINLSYDNDIEILRNAFNLSVSQINNDSIIINQPYP